MLYLNIRANNLVKQPIKFMSLGAGVSMFNQH